MRSTLLLCFLLLVASSIAACGGATSQHLVEFPAFGAGVAATPIDVADGWSVTLSVAQIGFGPAYFCANAGANADNCPEAVAELRAFTVVDGLDPSAQPIGSISGVTGTVRSATYDYDVSWFQTQNDPTPADLAPGGHSAHFEGTAVKSPRTLTFSADVDVEPQRPGNQAVNAAVIIESEITADTSRMDARFDPSRWFLTANFDAIAAMDSSGAVVVVPAGSQSLNGVVQKMQAGFPPTFEWTEE